jgi:hypothetical protein
MTVQFMVLGGPRSGSTWAANWLTTDRNICLHDPLLEYTKHQLDIMEIPGHRIGISCTSSILFPEWVLKHPARKAILYRETDEINYALEALGLTRLEHGGHARRLKALIDVGIPVWWWQSLFDRKEAMALWTHLIPDMPFDPYRHQLLSEMNIQPQWKRLALGKEGVADLVTRIGETLGVPEQAA